MSADLFLVGRFTGTCPTVAAVQHWEFQGIFETRERAEAACRDDSYCVCPVRLNEEIPHELSEFPGCYYPKAGGPIDAEGFQWHDVESSNVAAIAWKTADGGFDGSMRVRFASGGIYEYANVSIRTFFEFKDSKSKGEYLARIFKANPLAYPCTKVEPKP